MKQLKTDYSFLIPLDEEHINIVVLEAPEMFREFVENLTRECEAAGPHFTIWDGLESCGLSKRCCVVTDYFTLDLNSRRLSTALAKWLKEEATAPELFMHTQQMKAALMQWLAELTAGSSYRLEYAPEPDISALLKSVGIAFAVDTEGVLDRLVSYLRLMQEYVGLELAFLVNAKRFFGPEELEQLYRFAAYAKLRLVLVENVEQRDDPDRERFFIVDRDGCEIFEDAL